MSPDQQRAEILQMVEVLLPGMQKQAAERQDRVAVALLDTIWAFDKRDDLSLIYLAHFRLTGAGRAAGDVAFTALRRLSAMMGCGGF